MQLAVLISSLIFRLTLAAAPPPPASTSVCGAQRSPRGLLSSQHGLLAPGKRPGWRPSPLHIYLQQQQVINVGKGENVQQLIKLLAVIFKYSLNIFWPFLDLQFCNLCCLMWKSKSLHYLKTRGFKQSFLGCNISVVKKKLHNISKCNITNAKECLHTIWPFEKSSCFWWKDLFWWLKFKVVEKY